MNRLFNVRGRSLTKAMFAFLFFVSVFANRAEAQRKISDLVVAGEGIKWYDAATGGNEYTTPATTNLVNGQVYYASQTVNGIESITRKVVTAVIITAPTFTSQPTTGSYNLGQELTYNTQLGMTNYTWVFPGDPGVDYNIVAGGIATNSVSVRYLSIGNKTVTVNYTSPEGCTAATATSSNTITINPL